MQAIRNAVVTGGASGIGRAIVEELVAKGCRVVLADIDSERARSVAADVGSRTLSAACDVSKHSDVVALSDFAQRELGAVDVVFANAGVGLSGRIVDADPEAFDWVFAVNVKGTWNTVSVFGKKMRDAGQEGHLCITGSEHSLGMQHVGMGLYSSTKHAILGMADVLRSELPDRIGVSVLCPGLVATELHLSKRYGPLPQDARPILDFSAEVMSRGMPAQDIGRAAVRGVERGDFFIVTHPAALAAATKRYQQIADSFAAQTKWSPESERYEVNAVVAAVHADRSKAAGVPNQRDTS